MGALNYILNRSLKAPKKNSARGYLVKMQILGSYPETPLGRGWETILSNPPPGKSDAGGPGSKL